MRTATWTGVATLALAVAVCGSAAAQTAAGDERSSGSTSAGADGQTRIATTTGDLERALSEMFVRGQIDRDALAPLVDDVVQAMPEEARPTVEAHIAQVIDAGVRLAAQLTPEQRAQLASAPAAPSRALVQMVVTNALGWPIGAGAGWGGPSGAPPINYNCIPYSNGYAVPFGGVGPNGFTSGYSAGNFSSLACGGGYGYGLGPGGWGW